MSISFSTLLIIVFVTFNAAALYCLFKAYDLLIKPPKLDLDPYKDLDTKDLDELRQALKDLDETSLKFRTKLYRINKQLGEACK